MAKTDIKITKQDLERDEVLEFTDHLIFFLRSHGQKIVIAVALFFIAWSIVILMNNRKEGTLRAASDQLFVALTTYERALSDTEFGSEERVAAMAGVAELADKVRSQFPDTEVSRTALFLKGNAFYFSGDKVNDPANTTRAIGTFEEYRNLVAQDGDQFEKAAAILSLAKAQENLYVLSLGDMAPLNKAMEQYEEVIAMPDARFLRYEAMVGKARVLEAQGKRAEAEEIYKTVVSEKYELTVPADSSESQGRQLLHNIRNAANNLTTAAEAHRALVRMGMDPEDVDALVKPEDTTSS